MWLAYKSYDIKVSYGALRKFDQNHDIDLDGLLVKYIDTATEASMLESCTTVKRVDMLNNVAQKQLAAEAFHAVIEADNITLEEIIDGMYSAGMIPSIDKDDKCEPYGIVMLMLAYEVAKQMNEMRSDKKKAVTLANQ